MVAGTLCVLPYVYLCLTRSHDFGEIKCVHLFAVSSYFNLHDDVMMIRQVLDTISDIPPSPIICAQMHEILSLQEIRGSFAVLLIGFHTFFRPQRASAWLNCIPAAWCNRIPAASRDAVRAPRDTPSRGPSRHRLELVGRPEERSSLVSMISMVSILTAA